MRNKSVLPKTVERYLDFLSEVKSKAYGDFVCMETIDQIIARNQINKTVSKALTQLKIVEFIDKNSWYWLKGEPDKAMVLNVLDYLLHLKKPTTQPPILPEWATMLTVLKEIRDSLNVIPKKENKVLQGLKLSQQELRIDTAVKIAASLFFNKSNLTGQQIIDLNSDAILIADDLLKQLNNNSTQ